MKKYLLFLLLCSFPLFVVSAQDTSDYEVITLDNAARLEQIAVYGRGLINDVEWSPDGEMVAAGSITGVWMYNPDTPEAPPQRIAGSEGDIFDVEFSRDSRMLVASGQQVKVWDTQTREHLRTLDTFAESVAINPIGSIIATSSQQDAIIRLWDVETGEAIATLEGHTEGIIHIAFSPTENVLISTSLDDSIRLWDIDHQESLVLYQGLIEILKCIAFTVDGRLLAVSDSDNTYIWNMETREEIFVLNTTNRSFSFTPDGHYLIGISGGRGGYGGSLWEVSEEVFDSDPIDIPSMDTNTHVGDWRLLDFAFNPQGTRLAISDMSDIMFYDWNGSTANIWRWNIYGNSAFTKVTFSHNGDFLVAQHGLYPGLYDDGDVIRWNLVTGAQEINPADSSTYSFYSERVSHDNALVAAFSYNIEDLDGNIYLRDTETGETIITLEGFDQVFDVSFNPQDTLLASANSGLEDNVKLWDVQTGSQLASIASIGVGNFAWASDVAFNLDGSLLAVAYDSATVLWDVNEILSTGVADSALVTTLAAYPRYVFSVAFSPDGRLLASAGVDGTVRVWAVRPEEGN